MGIEVPTVSGKIEENGKREALPMISRHIENVGTENVWTDPWSPEVLSVSRPQKWNMWPSLEKLYFVQPLHEELRRQTAPVGVKTLDENKIRGKGRMKARSFIMKSKPVKFNLWCYAVIGWVS